MSQATLPAVATNFFTECKKCAAERYHKVLTHVTSTSAKMQCEVCGATKKYTLPKKKKPTTKRAAAAPKLNHEQVWQDLKTKVGITGMQKYNTKSKFAQNAAIEHPTFGVGFVATVVGQKIEVIFQDGPKFLVHDRP